MSEQKFSAVETVWIRAKALDLGLAACGVAPAEKFPELENYSEWVERGYAGEMKYLEDRRRFDPREPMSGVRSLIVCALNYNTGFPYSTEAASETVVGSEGTARMDFALCVGRRLPRSDVVEAEFAQCRIAAAVWRLI